MTHENRSLRAIDLKKEWTLRQEELAFPIVQEFANLMKTVIDKTGIQTESGEQTPVNDINTGIDLLSNLPRMKKLPELLALLWIEESEKRFSADTYEDRVDFIKDLPYPKIQELKEGGLSDFFDFIIPSLMENSAFYLQAQTKAEPEKSSVQTES